MAVANLKLSTSVGLFGPRAGPVFPPEIIMTVVEGLEEDYETLFHLSYTSKVLHVEAQRVLYKTLYIEASDERDERGWIVPAIFGPPPELLLKNPSLARHLRSITYLEHDFSEEFEAMHILLSGSFADNMPNLKYLHVEFGYPVPKGFLSPGFQLEELIMDDPSYVLCELWDGLQHQKRLKILRVNSEIDVTLLPPTDECGSWWPELHTLEASFNVIDSLLPAHNNIKNLSWEHCVHDDPLTRLEGPIARSFGELQVFRYVLCDEVPRLPTIAKHLKNVKHLVLELELPSEETPWSNSAPEEILSGLSKLKQLKRLTLVPSEQLTEPMLSSTAIESIFKACTRIEFIDIEVFRHNFRCRQFVRWVKEQGKCRTLEELVDYASLTDFREPGFAM